MVQLEPRDTMDKQRVDEYARALVKKGVSAPCPRCSFNEFAIVGESMLPIQEKPDVMTLGGPSVPVVMVACKKCGFLSLHAVRPLGMMLGDDDV